MIETISTSDIKSARAAHTCDWCNGPIEVGASYRRYRNVYDGEIYTWKEHPDCRALANKYDDAVGCDDGIPEMREWEIDYLSAKDRQEYARNMNRAAVVPLSEERTDRCEIG